MNRVLLGIALGSLGGLLGAFAAVRMLKTLLFGIAPTDLLTFSATTAFLIAVGLLACWLPVLRAAKVDPLIALRTE